MEVSEILGLDVGMKRTGIARASSVAKIAEPLMTVETAGALSNLDEIIKDKGVRQVVVGLPRNLEGQDTGQTKWVRQWVDGAKQKLDATFYWQDEALTTKLAEAKQLSEKKITDSDALAAAIILQDFLDAPEAERVIC